MRKFTSFLLLMVMMITSLPTLAQLPELVLQKITIGAAAETLTPDTQWYLVWNKREYTTSGGGYWEDKGAGQRAYMSAGTSVISDNDYASDKAQYLVRFISTEVEGQYKIQFGTGNYFKSGALETTATASEAGLWNAYNINGESGHFAFNKWDKADIIDQNGSGATLAFWGSGEVTETGGNNDYTIYPVELTAESKTEYLKGQLNTRLVSYDIYIPDYGTESFDRGTEIGQYAVSDEIHDKFINSLITAQKVLEGTQTMTDDEMEQLIKDIDDSYAAIIASLVELTIPDGNYRIISAMEWTNSIQTDSGEKDEEGQIIYTTTETHPTKAIYGKQDDGVACWANIDSTDCRYLWKLTNKGSKCDSIQVMNIATDGIINTCTQSAQATLAKDSETVMNFKYVRRNDNGDIVIALKPAQSGDYGYLHAGGHGGGKGTAGNVVGWSYDASAVDATQWILQPVTDEEVNKLVEDYAPIKNHELMVQMFQELIAKGDSLVEVATDMTKTKLITNADQLSSEVSDPEEGTLAGLIDGDASTFWHATWHEENTPADGVYYFIAAMDEAIGGTMMVTYTRRNTGSDQLTSLELQGSNELEGEYTPITTIAFPYSSNSESLTSETFNVETPYQYFKFIGTATSNNRGYWHAAEMQLYSINENPTNQLVGMGEIGTNLVNALKTAKEVDVDDLEIEDYNALKAAYDAAKAAYVDPTALRAAIEANEHATDNVVVGDNPGFWSADSQAGSLVTILEAAKAYDKAGVYTQTKTDEYIKQIEKGVSDVMGSANKVQTDKWYAIRFASEEMYDKYGWAKGNVVNTTLGDLYENYLAPANIDEEGALAGMSSLSEVGVGQNLRFINEEQINEMDQVAFRFVAQGDTAYVIQHKSGLFVNAGESGNAITLGLKPALFNVEAVGLGKVVIKARNLDGTGIEEDDLYLHAQNAGHSLVTWYANGVNTNSALFIEAVDDMDEGDEVADKITFPVLPNSMRILCYATSFSVQDGELYEYKGAFYEDGKRVFGFNKIEKAAAGQPVLYVNGDIDTFDKAAEMENDYITIEDYTFAAKADTINGIHGTYVYDWVDEGRTVVYGGDFASWGCNLVAASGEEYTDCTRDISGNTGYIVYGENILKDAKADDFDLTFSYEAEDEVPAKMGDVNADGTVDGSDIVALVSVVNAAGYGTVYDLDVNGTVDGSDIVILVGLVNNSKTEEVKAAIKAWNSRRSK